MPKKINLKRLAALRAKGRMRASKKDSQQDKRIRALERVALSGQGWIDSVYRETTMNGDPQLISRGVQNSAAQDPEFFVMSQGTDGSDKDHKRIGLSINATSVHARITISARGATDGYPPTVGGKTGKNQVRLLGVIYKTLADFNTGLAGVLENPTRLNTQPARVIDSFFKKQSSSQWHIWCDKKFSVPFTTQTKKIGINYKIPKKYQKMVYATDLSIPSDTNIMVLYAFTGIRDNAQNDCTLQATYRCYFDK